MLLYVALAGNQLFLKPVTGLADNGDFPKVLGHLSVCDPNQEHDVFNYVYPTYSIDPGCRWDSGLTSSESLFVRAIKRIAVSSGRVSFSIKGAGKAHLSVVVLALMVLLWAMHGTAPVVRFGVPPLILWIFSDVAYVSYLNAFFMDTASMVFLLLTVALAVAAALRPGMWSAIAFGIAGVLLVTSKSQHAILGIFFAGLAILYGVRSSRAVRWVWGLAGIAILVAVAVMFSLTTEEYKTYPLFNLIFFRLAPQSPDPGKVLAAMSLPESDLQYVGMHSYSPNTPVTNAEFRKTFLHQTSYVKLARFYLEHPAIPFRIIRTDLAQETPYMRPPNIGNYEKSDAVAPGALARRFDSWSNLRASLLRSFPAHVVILVLVTGVGSGLCFFRPSLAARWPLYPLVLVLAISGTVEFLFSVLLDALETARHLFIFHVITEILIVCTFAAALSCYRGRPREAMKSENG